jgi:aminoglycoside phosphotransferase (APT) family kinase protein
MSKLQAALNCFDLGEFLRAEPIPFGLFGQNMFVTSYCRRIVLRGAPHYDWQFPTEKFFIEQLQANTRVPVPYPYRFQPCARDFRLGLCDHAQNARFAIGGFSSSGQLIMDQRRGVARALAAMLIEIQTLTWEYSGRYDATTQTVRDNAQDYRSWIMQRTRELSRRRKAITRTQLHLM